MCRRGDFIFPGGLCVKRLFSLADSRFDDRIFYHVDENEQRKLATEFSGAEIFADFLTILEARNPATRGISGRTLYRMANWTAHRSGNGEAFSPKVLTRTALANYLGHLE